MFVTVTNVPSSDPPDNVMHGAVRETVVSLSSVLGCIDRCVRLSVPEYTAKRAHVGVEESER